LIAVVPAGVVAPDIVGGGVFFAIQRFLFQPVAPEFMGSPRTLLFTRSMLDYDVSSMTNCYALAISFKASRSGLQKLP
jgi:hypothetical protein